MSGSAETSLIWKRVSGDASGPQMPLDEPPLSKSDQDLIARWIDQGAKWPAGVGAVNVVHWAYKAPQKSKLPKLVTPPNASQEWGRNALDHFALAKMRERGLWPSPPAEPAKLLRRAYLDLIGMPPSVEALDAFLADPSPQAFEAVVDRLLASPRYGERWARPWLDLARYADSNGYQADQFRSVWAYRDWVIQSMNDDMPFDRFTLHQIAGDLLPNSSINHRIATGFHRLTTCNVEAGVDPEENRVEQIIDRVNTTATVWLGATLECAQCHDHKYDPFDQSDYYKLFAYFNNTPLEVKGNGVTYNFYGPTMDLPLGADKQTQRTKLLAQQATINQQLKRIETTAGRNLKDWVQATRQIRSQQPKWQTLTLERFQSNQGAAHETLSDGSILVSGKKPETDVYSMSATADLDGVTAVRLETLTHPSLPGNGPGRHTAERPNFVLQDFRVSVQPINNADDNQGRRKSQKNAADSPSPGGKSRVLLFAAAQADFAQKGFDPIGAVDNDPKTGWAINPQFGKSHQAVFILDQPLQSDGRQERLQFRLTQNHGQGRTIGRLRISVLCGPPEQLTDSLPSEVVAALNAKKRNQKQTDQLVQYLASRDPQHKQLTKSLKRVEAQLIKVKPDTTLVMVEMDKRRTTHVLHRGDFKNPANKVQPAAPAILPITGEYPQDRIGLARWLTDRSNPLTARVTVNRWWAEFFGTGLVATLEDFGARGDRPTHPRLLDWLAVEFMESGWSRKHIHKLIVMSSTYQQSSRVSAFGLREDPRNNWLSRGPRLRLSAEMVRDNALQISGLFSDKQGGPPIYPPQPAGIWRHVGRNAPKYATSQGPDRFRRGIYVVWRRSAPYASFVNFDAPDRNSCVVRRPRTNTPLQALTLLNDPAQLEFAWGLAVRAVEDRQDDRDRMIYAFRRCVARSPSADEVDRLMAVLRIEQQRLKLDANAAKGLVADRPLPARTTPSEMAAWVLIGNILLNLDETITKG